MSLADPIQILCHVDDSLPGISRRRVCVSPSGTEAAVGTGDKSRTGDKSGIGNKSGTGDKSGTGAAHWAWFDPIGRRIHDPREIARLEAIGMPPAYDRCWFCPDPRGHIQATGYDARGRKQYRYHPDFRTARDADKYDCCAEFGRALPLVRQRVEQDLAGRALSRDAVIAAIVRLLDLGRVRIGNEAYAKANRSFGATTLRRRHARVSREEIRLSFVGKSGKAHRITIADRRLAAVVRRCQDLPGQQLFQYVDAEGQRHRVGSSEVNAYLRETMGASFSAKHFRTWGASLIAFEALATAQGPLPLKALLDPVCAALGNTPAIARKSYVHPALIDAARTTGLPKDLPLPRRTKYLSRNERGLIAFLDRLAAPLDDGITA